MYINLKRILALFILGCIFSNDGAHAQKNNDGAAAAAGIALGIIAGAIAYEEYKETLELAATEWFLENNTNVKNFRLKVLDLDGTKPKNLSPNSIITFEIQEFDPRRMPSGLNENSNLYGRKFILFAITSAGWVNEYGIDYKQLGWFLINQDEWLNMMKVYVQMASGYSGDEETLTNEIKSGKVVNKGLRKNTKLEISFYNLTGDMYLSQDYNDDFKIIYNENSLGIYLNETNDLIQISRNTMLDIHKYFFKKFEPTKTY